MPVGAGNDETNVIPDSIGDLKTTNVIPDRLPVGAGNDETNVIPDLIVNLETTNVIPDLIGELKPKRWTDL